MKPKQAIRDEEIAVALTRFVAVADALLVNPGRWLPMQQAEHQRAESLHQRALATAQRKVLGDIAPGAAGWEQLPFERRAAWWVHRISNLAAVAAAAPRVAGAFDGRLPVQAMLGASGAGLVVCALAGEAGITDRNHYVWLLGMVVFSRDLNVVLMTAASSNALTVESAPFDDEDAVMVEAVPTAELAALAPHLSVQRRAFNAMLELARSLRQIEGLLDERPRGGFVARTVAKVPVAGVAGGWLDERKAMRRAADHTMRLLPRQEA